jgi:putative sterol carrier protein
MKYLSTEWVEAGRRLVEGHPLVVSRTKGVKASILCIIHDSPDHVDDVMFIDFDDGQVKEIYAGTLSEFERRKVKPVFVVEGEYETFVEIQEGRLTQATALMKGRLRLRGSLFKALKHMRALEAITQILGEVPTEY